MTEALVDVAVIGAGVIGAAVAARLARGRRSVCLVDGRSRVGGDVSERNSGVIHAGLHHPRDWLRTRLCVAGNRALYEWAARHDVPHRRSGKLIVAASDEDEAALAEIAERGRGAGVEELSLVTGSELRRLEPELRGQAALRSGSSGIVDPHALTRSLAAAAASDGADQLLGAPVTAIERATAGWRLHTGRGSLDAKAVVNAAGLGADRVAALAGVTRHAVHPCRGDYYRLRRRLACRRLVYPVRRPGAVGLGVHLTLDLGGGSRLGPDAEYVASRDDYGPPRGDKRAAFAAGCAFLPDLTVEDLEYDGCGIRPTLRAPGEAEERDFVIAEDLPGLINLVGIESPGLTAALAIADHVAAMIGAVE